MAGERVLIVEDDALLRSVVAERLQHDGLEVSSAPTLAEARRLLDAAVPDVVLLDMRLPDGEGIALLREAPPSSMSGTAWVVMTAHATVSLAVEALKLGARDFLEKPFSLDRAVATVRQALEWSALRREVAALREKSSIAGTTVIGESPAMQKVFDLVRRLAEAGSSTVLIEGESGTGKGAIAQALHRLSPRASGPFLNVTCSALPETLMESELFGHEKGAFTDAHAAKRGLVEMAHGGTLFLDEIAELTPGVQAKLLRFLEDKAFRRLGGTKDLTVDVRIMAATNRSLADEVAAGRFRADLFYRLHVVPIMLPPLRERCEDIAPLAAHFLDHFTREFGKRVTGLAPEAREALEAYDWPGNVRELRNVIERAVLLVDGDAIEPEDLPAEVTHPALAAVPAGNGHLMDVERQMLVDALDKVQGNQSRAAKMLGISRHQIRTRMKRWGLLALTLLTWPLGLSAQTATERALSARCELCHADREVLARQAPVGWRAESLLVSHQALATSAHKDVPCVRCHPQVGVTDHPAQPRGTVPCGTCHAAADSLWRKGPHARTGQRPGHLDQPNAACKACHGFHDVQPAQSLLAGPGLVALTARCVGCHTDRALKPGDVHRGRVNCASCHGAHMIQPVRDPATHGIPLGIADNCAKCHDSVATIQHTDIHGSIVHDQASGRLVIHGDTAPTCVACHGGHGIQPAHKLEREVALVDLCGRCHAEERESYRETYHGRANRLGYYRAARCDDCHTGHQVFPSSDPRATTNLANRPRTCGKCHDAAKRPLFMQYRAHVKNDMSAGLPIFGTWLFMNVLLMSVFTVFGLHTMFWLKRLLQLKWQERQRRIALGLPPKAERIPLDSSERGEGPYVWRFKLVHRLVHGVSVVSFFALIITGVPLKFSCAVWAPGLMRLLGGTYTAGIIHRVAGAITVAYFTFHVVHMLWLFAKAKDRKAMLWGSDSMIPQPRDFRDFLQMWKWFFGKAEFPKFPRYGYNEKFHYLGAFWGIVLLGGSGLVRWFPGIATAVLPGWAFNVAAILHSDEALLAAGFMFIIHFFNVHMRPDKFPMDGVMFTGRVRLEELAKDHAETAAAIGSLEGVPVSTRSIPDLPAPPPPPWMSIVAAIGGLGALGVGLTLVGMVMWVQVC